jgi:hypothetical protein
MSTTTVPEHAFRRCATLLLDSHRLTVAGDEESDQAENIRSEMDPLW